MKTSTIPFADLRRFLKGLGWKEKVTEKAQVFQITKERILVFRRYSDNEMVDHRELMSARKFLDGWGILEAADFDAFLEGAATSA